jgi:hypothetical protein
MKSIVPWICKCHDCGSEFGLSGGGLCKKCGLPTCNRCLGVGAISRHLGVGALRQVLRSMKPESPVCRSCAAKEEKNASD